jgi:hypothetical protein
VCKLALYNGHKLADTLFRFRPSKVNKVAAAPARFKASLLASAAPCLLRRWAGRLLASRRHLAGRFKGRVKPLAGMREINVRFAPDSDQIADIAEGPKSARSRLMQGLHCSCGLFFARNARTSAIMRLCAVERSPALTLSALATTLGFKRC